MIQEILSTASPIGAIVLCLIIILQLTRQSRKVDDLSDNHLHEMLSKMDLLVASQERIEKALTGACDRMGMSVNELFKNQGDIKESLSYIKARMNGKHQR